MNMIDWLTILFLGIPIVILPIRSYQRSKKARKTSMFAFIEYFLLFAVALYLVFKNNITIKDINLNPLTYYELLKITSSVCIILSFDFYSFLILRRLTRYQKIKTLPSLQYEFSKIPALNKLFTFLFCLFSAAWEEFFFRALLFYYFQKMGMYLVLILIVSSTLFAANHVYNGRSSIYYSFIYGSIFSLLYWITGSLTAVILSHAIGNIFVVFVTIPKINKNDQIVFI